MSTTTSPLASAAIVTFIPTIDVARAKHFYAEILGLSLVAEDPFAMTFDANGISLRVTPVQELQPYPFTVLGWWVADAPATVDELAVRGVVFERYPGMEQDERGLWSPPGSRVQVGWFKDPDGNTLSITAFCA